VAVAQPFLFIICPQIEQGEQDCVIEDGVFHDNLSTNSMALVLADIKNLPSQLTYVDNNLFLSYSVPGDGNCFFHSLSLYKFAAA
jgi:hypothetical protein